MKGSIITLILFLHVSLHAQTESKNLTTMKLNAGIITHKIAETKQFYTDILDFGVSFENEFYLLMHTPNHASEISFLQPHHPSQEAIFQTPSSGQGTYFTIEVEDVDALYKIIKDKGVKIEIDIRDEVWGDRHFAIVDPNGIGIDIVTYAEPDTE